MTLSLPVDDDANELLSRDPLALLIAMLLDQQVPLEKAFAGPRDLVKRLGHEPTAAELADYDPEALAAVFSERPALHRYPKAMAGRTQALCRLLVERYDGDAAQVWNGAATGKDLVKRIGEVPGFGPANAQIVAAPARQPGPSARKARTTRSPTSWTTTRWPRSVRTSSR